MAALTPDIAQTEAAIVEMTNDFRARQNLAPVAADPVLAAAARAFAQYLARNNAFSHTADGQTPSQRAQAAGYQGCRLAENLALHRSSEGFTPWLLAHSAVEGWINSPGHRANLLTPGATDIAVAVERVPDAHPKYVAVQLLARALSKAVRFSILNNIKRAVAYNFGGKRKTVNGGTRVNYTSCDDGALTFDAAAPGAFTPASGALYTITETAAGGLEVHATFTAQPR